MKLNEHDKDRVLILLMAVMFLILVSMVQSCAIKREHIKRNNCDTYNK